MNANAETATPDVELIPIPPTAAQPMAGSMEVYLNKDTFAAACQMAKSLMASTLVPEAYRSNLPNCLIALEMATRIKASPLQVMQSLDLIHGRPSWRSTFIIASINTCGRFSPLRFRMEGKPGTMDRACTATAIERETGELPEGPAITMTMAKAEGWLEKNGSKWKTMPELMLRYRAAAFFGRLYAPEMLLGMQTIEEQQDVIDVTPKVNPRTDAVIIDGGLIDQWVGNVKELLASDSKDEYEQAAGIREIHEELTRFDALYTAVSDRLAREEIITKAQWKKMLEHYPPVEQSK
jgi:hypothetical protein